MAPGSRSSFPLIAAGLLALLAALLWVVLAGDPPQQLGPEPAESQNSTDSGPQEAELGSLPDPGPRQLRSDLVKARLTVLISAPAWAQLPDSVEVKLHARGDLPEETRVQRTRIGGALVEFEDLLFGNYEIEAAAPGFVTATVPISVSREAHAPRQVVPLLPAREIVGEVRNHRNEVVAGVEVSARPAQNIPGFIQTHATTTTDEQGRYRLQPLPEGEFWVHVGQLRSPINDPVKVELRGERVFQDLKLGPLAAVTFTLVNEVDQSRVAGARVQIQRHAQADERGHMEYRMANGEGEVRFAHVPPGEYGVTVIANGYKSTSRTYRIEEGADGAITIYVLPLQ